MPTWKVISYSTNVWTATALYNFLESLWIYNAHLFVPITPLGHGHFRNRTFSVALICFFFSHRSYPIGHMLIGILTFDTRTRTSQHKWGSCQANHAAWHLISTPQINSITAQKELINGWQETETTMYSCRYMNNHNYGTTCTLNPKKKTWRVGGRGKSGNGRWQQKQLNSKTPCDLKNRGHMNPHSYQCVRKTFSAPFFLSQ